MCKRPALVQDFRKTFNSIDFLGKEMKDNIKSTLKSSDTEEWLDTVWTRPIGYMWAKFFDTLNIHPNTVTILSMIIGAASALFFVHGSYRTEGIEGIWYNIAAMALLAWANFYDSADGQLARMTGKKTQLGRILDGAAGDVWFLAIYHALFFRMLAHHDMEFAMLGIENNHTNTVIFAVCFYSLSWFSGIVCHGRQCGLADYYRQAHLFFLRGKEGSELDNSEQQKHLYESTAWKGNVIEKLFLKTYVNYTKSQEAQTPAFQRLMAAIKERYGTAERIPESLRGEYRALSLPLLKWTNILTFNTRAIALYVFCLADLPWMYIVFEIVVMSAIYLHMRYWHEHFCNELYDKYFANK